MFNKDFYPTPKHLISKMIEGIDFSIINSVLEPSAGKGDICDYIKSRCESISYRCKLDIDTIEIDDDLISALKGKGYKVIHNDFLTFNSQKKYDLIIANFPFSDGDKHLQKAIELLELYGGNLICLVNAETIKNRYSNLREVIYNKLLEYNATIAFLADEFVSAERKTSVEVALIKLSIIKTDFNSLIFDDLKKSVIIPDKINDNTQIVDGDFIKSLIQRFNFESSLGIKLINEWLSLKDFLTNKFSKDDDYKSSLISLQINGSERYSENYINNFLRELRYKYWNLLLSDNRFTKNYTSNIINDLYNKKQDLKDYDFSEFNVLSLQKELNYSIIEGIEKSILSLFDEMSAKHSWGDDFSKNIHYYNGWKTNKAYKINKKVILPINGFSAYSYSGDKLDWQINKRLDDMVKVFNYLANEITDTNYLIESKLKLSNDTRDFRNIGLHYFDVSFYKKGTCHIVFKDDNLLEKFNIFGSQRKGWLPPSYGKSSYADMSNEDRNIIDEFQGKEKYEEVCIKKDYFIIDDNKLLLN